MPPEDTSLSVADLGRDLFQYYASDIWERCGEEAPDPLEFIHAHEPLTSYVTYPVRCIRLVEILGMLGLLELEKGKERPEELAEYIVQFFEKNPGATHPISDRWAVSLVPSVLILARNGYKDEIDSLLREVVRWIGDHYEANNFGLAGPHATPEEEVNYLLGAPFEHVALQRRSDSYVSTIVLDLAAVLEMTELFELARNDFLAVKAMSCVVEVDDTISQYIVNAQDLNCELNMGYKEKWDPIDGWKVAPHHNRGPVSYYLSRVGRLWDHLALSIVLRDRHFPMTWRNLVDKDHGD